jgi:hypothetical protein
MAPMTWHVAYGDLNVLLTYVIIHIHTRATMP